MTVNAIAQPKIAGVPTRASNEGILTDFLAGFGAAYVVYLVPWSHLVSLRSADLFWMKAPPPPLRYLALTFSTFLLAVVCFAAIRMARHRRSFMTLAARVVLILIAAAGLNALRELLAGYYPDEFGGNILRSFSVPELILLAGVLTLLLIGFLAWIRKALFGAGRFALIAVGVVGFWAIAQGAYQVAVPPASAPVRANAAYLPQRPGSVPKIVWLVFDEFDYRLAFVNRARDLALPVLDNFAKTAIQASQAYPPFSSTGNSLLTYISGEKVTALRSDGEDLIVRTVEHPQRRHWRDVPNLFAMARQVGVNSAVVGWYLPYSRLVNSDVVDCWWFNMGFHGDGVGSRLPEMLVNIPRSVVETSLLSPFGQSLLTQRRARLFNEFMDKTRHLLANDRVQLLLLHIPVPHTPYFYDRRTGQQTLANSTISGYWDALALVDRTLGDVEAELKNKGEWDNSVVLVSSDHYYRTAMRIDGRMDRRIPFLLKMPRQTRAWSFDMPFNTQLAHNLILEIARQNVRTDEQAMAWLRQWHAAVPVGWDGQRASADSSVGNGAPLRPPRTINR